MPTSKPTSEQTTGANGVMSDPSQEPSFGWNIYAERMNGRFAMLGFVSVLLIEALTGQGLLTWMGLR